MKNILFSLFLFSVPVMTWASEAPKKSASAQLMEYLNQNVLKEGISLEEFATQYLSRLVSKSSVAPLAEACIMCGADVNGTKSKIPFIWHATNNQAMATAKLLLDHKADVNAQGPYGSCLNTLALRPSLEQTALGIKMLLHYKADPTLDLERIQNTINDPRYAGPEIKALLEEAIAHRLAEKKQLEDRS